MTPCTGILVWYSCLFLTNLRHYVLSKSIYQEYMRALSKLEGWKKNIFTEDSIVLVWLKETSLKHIHGLFSSTNKTEMCTILMIYKCSMTFFLLRDMRRKEIGIVGSWVRVSESHIGVCNDSHCVCFVGYTPEAAILNPAEQNET